MNIPLMSSYPKSLVGSRAIRDGTWNIRWGRNTTRMERYGQPRVSKWRRSSASTRAAAAVASANRSSGRLSNCAGTVLIQSSVQRLTFCRMFS